MKFWALLVIVGTACASPARQHTCHEVASERIFTRDLVAALPAFGSLAPDTPVAFAPLPGAQRVMHAAEVASLARRYSIELRGVQDLCFEWRMRELDPGAVLEVMRTSLEIPDAAIEIVELSRQLVPQGRIEFPRERMGAPASPEAQVPVLWRGNVVYGGNRRFAIWARVKVRVKANRVVAAESLRTGRPVDAGQLRIESSVGFPPPANIARSLDQVAGRLPLRPIPAGATVHLDQLAAPFDVNRGDIVDVEVRTAATHLSFSGKAETAGRSGDMVAIRNEASNRLFQARVNGKRRALVVPRTRQVK